MIMHHTDPWSYHGVILSWLYTTLTVAWAGNHWQSAMHWMFTPIFSYAGPVLTGSPKHCSLCTWKLLHFIHYSINSLIEIYTKTPILAIASISTWTIRILTCRNNRRRVFYTIFSTIVPILDDCGGLYSILTIQDSLWTWQVKHRI